MKSKQTLAESLPKRIAIVAAHPYKFLEDVCEAYVRGYRVDINGCLLLNVATSAYMAEMTLSSKVMNE